MYQRNWRLEKIEISLDDTASDSLVFVLRWTRLMIGLMGLFLQALKDVQHPPTGTGAGVPSGQTLKSKVQNVPAQLTARKDINLS